MYGYCPHKVENHTILSEVRNILILLCVFTLPQVTRLNLLGDLGLTLKEDRCSFCWGSGFQNLSNISLISCIMLFLEEWRCQWCRHSSVLQINQGDRGYPRHHEGSQEGMEKHRPCELGSSSEWSTWTAHQGRKKNAPNRSKPSVS